MDEAEELTHYKRTCAYCGNIWWGLHCPHDGYQNPCGKCGKRPNTEKEPRDGCDCDSIPNEAEKVVEKCGMIHDEDSPVYCEGESLACASCIDQALSLKAKQVEADTWKKAIETTNEYACFTGDKIVAELRRRSQECEREG